MTPTVTGVTEGRAIDPAGRVAKVVVVQYRVGTFGPFTLETSEAELSNGNAMQKMQSFANTLGQFPTP